MNKHLAGLVIAALLTLPAKADLITVDFSGVWDHDAGIVHAGDAFSGSASWDDSAFSHVGGVQALLTSFYLTTFDTPSLIVLNSGVLGNDQYGVFKDGALWGINGAAKQAPWALPSDCGSAYYFGTPSYSVAFRQGYAYLACSSDYGFDYVLAMAEDYQIGTIPRVESFSAPVVANPEPGTIAVLALALLALVITSRYRRCKSNSAALR